MTSSKEHSGKLRLLHNPAVISVIIAIISLAVTFTGTNYQNIGSWFSQQMFPTADFSITSFEAPLTHYFNFTQIRNVSSEYYVVTSVNLKSDVAYVGGPFQFSISFENKGKKTVEQPRILIYTTDFDHRVWSIWNESDSNKKIVTKGCNLEYYFPSLDQKDIGAWTFYVLLYDDSNGQLVSYAAKEFTTTDVAPIPWYQDTGFYVVIGFFVFVGLGSYITRYLRKRERKIEAELERKAMDKPIGEG